MFRVLAVVAIAASAFAPRAIADGDPASDVLYEQNDYVPYNTPDHVRVAALRKAISAASANGSRVKVAVIANRTDLGSVGALFNRPQAYAKFLGTEIASYYVGPLFVVMPHGFGLYNGAQPTGDGLRALKSIRVRGQSADELVETATDGVQALARAHALRWRDVLPPTVYPFTSIGRRGEEAQLRYVARDDSGYARVAVSIVTPEGVEIGAVTTKLMRITLHGLPSVAWQVPVDAPAELRFCVRATDPARHMSPRSCGLLHIS